MVFTFSKLSCKMNYSVKVHSGALPKRMEKKEKETKSMYKRNKENRCEELYEALLQVETVEECKKFLEDLCTVNELRAMEQRYQVATYLHSGMIYSDILERTGASSATISRVNRSLQYGAGGYEVVFRRLGKIEGSGE